MNFRTTKNELPADAPPHVAPPIHHSSFIIHHSQFFGGAVMSYAVTLLLLAGAIVGPGDGRRRAIARPAKSRPGIYAWRSQPGNGAPPRRREPWSAGSPRSLAAIGAIK